VAVTLNICGSDITIVATSSMVHVARQASEMLAEEGISAEVIDLRTIVPLDEETILASVCKRRTYSDQAREDGSGMNGPAVA
jgi:pyruvate/2-oxoglutarate/acetoin dehydrogenase E1 component